jgi:flagellar biosynthesis protein FliP
MRIKNKTMLLVGLTAAFALALLPWADALAQSLNIDLGKTSSGTASGRLIQMIALITIISLAPAILVMVTSFTRIIIVLSFVRSALGLQQTPPNQVLISLALFMTLFIMQPAFEKAYDEGVVPLMAEEISEQVAFDRIVEPFQLFMLDHVRQKDLELFMRLGGDITVATPEDTPLRVLIPAFMISELKRAFEIGFLIYVPFVVIDMLVASILMAMGMMMLPPVTISLPFKLVFFVLVDGWYLVCGSLIKSFG